ncbi:phenylacetate--CoA ligase family protein [Alcaligenes aquatilis]|uniref:phenylacetate--CoA ligase family protein n=1 Tax=Alcaligenes aquatilis TaxID=323284 RepID=UPI00214C558D|nr:AMP-binding protein [Alcaligenes aquatilis]
MSKDHLTDRFERLRRLQQHAFENAPSIRAIFERANMTPDALHGIDDLTRLPVTTKDKLLSLQREQPPFGGFLAADASAIKRVFVSPGPLYEPQLHADKTGHGFAEMFQRAGIGPGDKVLNTWAYHLFPAGLLLDDAITATGATVIPSGPGSSEQQAQLVMELGITCICASTSFFITLIETLERLGHDLPSSWKVQSAMLGGEMGDWMGKRRRLESKYGITTFSAYASGDFGLIGYEDPKVEGYLMHPDRMVQICDPKTGLPVPLGQPGEIVVTTLSEGWPLIRFGTGDIAIGLAETADGCVESISPLMGRVGQGIKVREVFIYPRNVDQVLVRTPAIPRAQLQVRLEGNREIAVLRAELESEALADGIWKDVSATFREQTRVKLDAVEWLKPGTLAADAPLLMDERGS